MKVVLLQNAVKVLIQAVKVVENGFQYSLPSKFLDPSGEPQPGTSIGAPTKSHIYNNPSHIATAALQPATSAPVAAESIIADTVMQTGAAINSSMEGEG